MTTARKTFRARRAKKGVACRVEAFSASLTGTRPGIASAGCSLISGAATSGGSECASGPCVAFPGSLFGMSPKKASAGRIFISGVVVSDRGEEAVSASETSSSSMRVLVMRGQHLATTTCKPEVAMLQPKCGTRLCRDRAPARFTIGPDLGSDGSQGQRRAAAHSFWWPSAQT